MIGLKKSEEHHSRMNNKGCSYLDTVMDAQYDQIPNNDSSCVSIIQKVCAHVHVTKLQYLIQVQPGISVTNPCYLDIVVPTTVIKINKTSSITP